MCKLHYPRTSKWDLGRWARLLKQSQEMFGTGVRVKESSEASEVDPKAQMTYCPQQHADDKTPELLSSVFEITLLGFA